jgi:hypothetical protein
MSTSHKQLLRGRPLALGFRENSLLLFSIINLTVAFGQYTRIESQSVQQIILAPNEKSIFKALSHLNPDDRLGGDQEAKRTYALIL